VSEELDERALIERCRTGDDTAFGELVERYKNLVYGLVYRLVADRTQVDDLAQDVFLKVHRGLPYFRGEARLSTWIYRIVQNVCFEARVKRQTAVSLDGPVDKDGGHRRIQYRLLIAAHYLDGVQYEALAESMDMPLGTVKTHLYRAKRRLREILET
jgi:RNA polymerase sigma-70 factor, ECF subfamily